MSVCRYDSVTDTITKVAGDATVPIDDTVASTDKVYSSSKVESLVNDWEDISSQCTVPSGVTQEAERPLKVYKNGKMICVNFSPKIMWDGVKEYIDVLNISGVTFPFEQRFFVPFQGMEGGINCLATNSKISIYKFDLFTNRIGVGYEKMFYINVFLFID